MIYRSICAQVGSSWLNPTEEALWPLEETLEVADLAFGALETCDKPAATDQGKTKSTHPTPRTFTFSVAERPLVCRRSTHVPLEAMPVSFRHDNRRPTVRWEQPGDYIRPSAGGKAPQIL